MINRIIDKGLNGLSKIFHHFDKILLLGIKIYLIFYISLLKDVTNVNAIKTGRDDVEIETNEYEVKKILNVRIKDGRIKYKVK